MKRSYFDEISNLYSEKVLVSEQTLNESMPPFEAGPTPDAPYKPYKPENFKAFTQPQYAGATRGVASREDFGTVLIPNILKTIGRALLKEIQGAGGRVPDSRQEMNRRAGAAITRLIQAGGKPLFQASHAQHLGRNVVDALIEAGHLKEIAGPRGGGGAKKTFTGSTDDISFGSDEPEEPPA